MKAVVRTHDLWSKRISTWLLNKLVSCARFIFILKLMLLYVQVVAGYPGDDTADAH